MSDAAFTRQHKLRLLGVLGVLFALLIAAIRALTGLSLGVSMLIGFGGYLLYAITVLAGERISKRGKRFGP